MNVPNNTITVDKIRKQQETCRLCITKPSNLMLSSTFFCHLMQTANRAARLLSLLIAIGKKSFQNWCMSSLPHNHSFDSTLTLPDREWREIKTTLSWLCMYSTLDSSILQVEINRNLYHIPLNDPNKLRAFPKLSYHLHDKHLYVDIKATLGLPVLISVMYFDQNSFSSSFKGTNLLCTAKWHCGSHLMEIG